MIDTLSDRTGDHAPTLRAMIERLCSDMGAAALIDGNGVCFYVEQMGGTWDVTRCKLHPTALSMLLRRVGRDRQVVGLMRTFND